MVRRKIIFLVILTAVLWAAGAGSQAKHLSYEEVTTSSVLLLPESESDRNPYVQYAFQMRFDEKKFEMAKLEFLFERIRKSPYHFVRNGRFFSGNEASDFLQWRLRHRYSKNKRANGTAEDFIARYATNSSTTGHPYELLLPDGKVYRFADVLHNELADLRTRIDQLETAEIEAREAEAHQKEPLPLEDVLDAPDRLSSMPGTAEEPAELAENPTEVSEAVPVPAV